MLFELLLPGFVDTVFFVIIVWLLLGCPGPPSFGSVLARNDPNQDDDQFRFRRQ